MVASSPDSADIPSQEQTVNQAIEVYYGAAVTGGAADILLIDGTNGASGGSVLISPAAFPASTSVTLAGVSKFTAEQMGATTLLQENEKPHLKSDFLLFDFDQPATDKLIFIIKEQGEGADIARSQGRRWSWGNPRRTLSKTESTRMYWLDQVQNIWQAQCNSAYNNSIGSVRAEVSPDILNGAFKALEADCHPDLTVICGVERQLRGGALALFEADVDPCAPQEEGTSGGSGLVAALVVVLLLLPTICGLLFVTYKYLFIIDRYVSGFFQKPTKDEDLDEEKGLEKGSERTIDTSASLVFANTPSKKENGSRDLPFDDINSRDLPFGAISDPVLQGGVEKGSRTSSSDSSLSSVVSASMGQQVDERLSGEQSENEPEPEGVAEQPSISLHEHLEEEEHVWSTQGVFAGSRHYLELLTHSPAVNNTSSSPVVDAAGGMQGTDAITMGAYNSFVSPIAKRTHDHDYADACASLSKPVGPTVPGTLINLRSAAASSMDTAPTEAVSHAKPAEEAHASVGSQKAQDLSSRMPLTSGVPEGAPTTSVSTTSGRGEALASSREAYLMRPRSPSSSSSSSTSSSSSNPETSASERPATP